MTDFGRRGSMGAVQKFARRGDSGGQKLALTILGEIEFAIDEIGDELEGVFVVFEVAVAKHQRGAVNERANDVHLDARRFLRDAGFVAILAEEGFRKFARFCFDGHVVDAAAFAFGRPDGEKTRVFDHKANVFAT